MLKLYDYLADMMEEHNNHQWFYETRLNYFASDVLEMLEVADPAEVSLSLNRKITFCIFYLGGRILNFFWLTDNNHIHL